MAFEDTFPVFAHGPRNDLGIAYVHADIGGTGAPTIDTRQTSAGFTITRSNDGIYALNFPKCKYVLPIGQVRPDDLTDVTDARVVQIAKNIDATTGTVVFQTAQLNATADAAIDPVSGSEIIFIVLLGF